VHLTAVFLQLKRFGSTCCCEQSEKMVCLWDIPVIFYDLFKEGAKIHKNIISFPELLI